MLENVVYPEELTSMTSLPLWAHIENNADVFQIVTFEKLETSNIGKYVYLPRGSILISCLCVKYRAGVRMWFQKVSVADLFKHILVFLKKHFCFCMN